YLQRGLDLALQPDLNEYGDREADGERIDQGDVALDVAAFLQPANARKARRRRQMDRARELDVADARIFLQPAQDVPVDCVEREFRHDVPRIGEGTELYAATSPFCARIRNPMPPPSPYHGRCRSERGASMTDLSEIASAFWRVIPADPDPQETR